MTAAQKRARKGAHSAELKDQGPSKLDRLVSLLRRSGGATLEEMTELTGWQAHSVRGAMAGALKKRGHTVNSLKADGMRRYTIGAAQ